MIRNGINPNGASPASRLSEREKAGPSEVTNSRHGDVHSTSSLGAASRSSTVSSTWSASITTAVWNLLRFATFR